MTGNIHSHSKSSVLKNHCHSFLYSETLGLHSQEEKKTQGKVQKLYNASHPLAHSHSEKPLKNKETQ